MLICVFTGFSSGLPLYILVSLLPAWLRSEGVNLKAIGLFALINLPFTWKFLWAPLFDRYIPKLAGLSMGRRRGWLLITQILLLLSIPLIALFNPYYCIKKASLRSYLSPEEMSTSQALKLTKHTKARK